MQIHVLVYKKAWLRRLTCLSGAIPPSPTRGMERASATLNLPREPTMVSSSMRHTIVLSKSVSVTTSAVILALILFLLQCLFLLLSGLSLHGSLAVHVTSKGICQCVMHWLPKFCDTSNNLNVIFRKIDRQSRSGTDFTYDAVDLAYGDILGQSPPPFRPIHTPTSTPTTIAEEKGIDKLGEACKLP